MNMLWSAKESIKEYSAKTTTIAKTFGVKYEQILCYERHYQALDENQLKQLLKDAKERKWVSLDLSNCGLKQLPDELWELESLKVLFLGNTNSINTNTFNEVSNKIEKLKNLEALSVCNISDLRIDKALKGLPRLTYLDCFGCWSKNIPNSIINKNIRGIGINCSETEQLKKICRIKKIEDIFLTNSQLGSLPIEIGNLTFLRTLCLRNSKVEVIPESILNLKQIKCFDIYGTPLASKIPQEMMKQNSYDLISFICRQQKQQEIYFFCESKMIIVGQGNVGKSCLLDRVMYNSYVEKESTEGIDVKKWVYNKNKKQYTLNIWDFGGQEIYHSTHQFFLTKRSLYVLVWDARAEEEYGRVDYWLKTIESFAEDSPVIICINKCDRNTTRINRIDFKDYKEKYPQIQTILDISCRDNINIDRLRKLITDQASNLSITKERWLKSWHDVRTEIENRSQRDNYITYDEYKKICKKYNVENEEGKSLSKYLHDLGIILHYQDDPFLRNIVILSPQWATSAVYRILDSQENVLRNRNGVLKTSDLPFIWNDFNLYPEEKHIFLLKIMEKFQLCYQLNEESYLVAELLENTSLDCPDKWDLSNKSSIRLVYKYDFMPAGIMTRFIVKINRYIARINGKDMCWRKGVYLSHKTAYASVIMKDTIAEKKIEVKVNTTGNSIHARELLYNIRKTINEINCNFKKINVEEFVPCNCSSNCQYIFPYSSLCNALDKKKETIQCYHSFKQVNVLKLLEGIEMIKHEEIGPYSISIQNNPVISNTVSLENSSTQTNFINIQELKNSVMEIQGDIAEITEEISEELEEESSKIKLELERINKDLECIGNMKTEEEVVKSGKLNKLKRWLANFSNEDSEIRKALSGAKNIVIMVSGLINKFNDLARKLGINILPPFEL